MEHNPTDSMAWNPQLPTHFTGEVHSRRLHQAGGGGLSAIAVRFAPRARSDWHHHPDGQVLYILEGSGWVVNRDGDAARVNAGDVVYAPPGEIHWHGATEDTTMINLSLTTGGPTEWLPEKVTDEQYRAPQGLSGWNNLTTWPSARTEESPLKNWRSRPGTTACRSRHSAMTSHPPVFTTC